MRFHRSPPRLTLLALCLLCVPAPAAPPARDGRLTLYLESEHGTPALMLRTRADRVVLIRAGAGYERLDVFASTDVPPETVRREAEEAARAAGLSGRVEARLVEDSARASVEALRPRPLALSGERTVAYGRMVDALDRDGHTLHAALRLPKASAAPPGSVELTREGARVWYDIGGAPAAAAVTARASLRPWHWLLALAVLLGGLAPVAALARGVWIATRREVHPLDRAWSVSFLNSLLFFPALATLFCAATLLMSGDLATVFDLWLAAAGWPVLRAIAVGYNIVYIGAALALWALKCRLERLADSAAWGDAPLTARAMAQATARTREMAPEPEHVDPEERALRRRVDRWKTAVRAAAFLGAVTLPNLLPDAWREYRLWVEFPLIYFAMAGVDWAFRIKSAPYRKHTPDAELTKEAQALAVRLGIRVREVEVDDTWEGRSKVSASYHKGRVVVSRRAVEVMNPREMRFILLDAIAGGSRAPNSVDWGMGVLMATILGYFALARPLMKTDPALWFLLFWVALIPAFAVMLLPIFLGGTRHGRTVRRMMDVLNDPEAMTTAMLKRGAQDMPLGTMLKTVEAEMARKGIHEPLPDDLRAALSGGRHTDGTHDGQT